MLAPWSPFLVEMWPRPVGLSARPSLLKKSRFRLGRSQNAPGVLVPVRRRPRPNAKGLPKSGFDTPWSATDPEVHWRGEIVQEGGKNNAAKKSEPRPVPGDDGIKKTVGGRAGADRAGAIRGSLFASPPATR